ncbi:MAG: hypothetical protein ABIC04_03300 [Nanoarchaeota archaeon]
MAKGMKLAAVVMMALIVTLPFYSANAMAALYITKAYGDSGKENFITEDDSLTIEVIATKGNVPLENDDRELLRYSSVPVPGNYNFQNTLKFDSCANGNCQIKFDTYNPSKNPATVFAYLYDCVDSSSCALVSWTSRNVVIDNTPPVTLISIEQINTQNAAFTSTAKIGLTSISINYNVKDYACSNCGTKCVGLNKVQFYAQKANQPETLLRTIEINSDTDDCSRTQTETFSTSQISTQSGTVEVWAESTDNFGNTAISNILPIIVDLDAPAVDPTKLVITDSLGGDGTYVPQNPKDKGFGINIALEIADAGKATLDLSALNPELTETEGNCAGNGNSYTCLWNDILLDVPATSSSVSLLFKAEDDVGNTATVPLTYAYTVVSTEPAVVDIISSHRGEDNKDYAGYNEKFILKLNQGQGPGFSKKNIFMDFSELRPTLNDKQADACTLDSGFWYCEFNDINTLDTTQEGTHSIRVLENSMDDLNDNLDTVSSVMQQDVIVDKTKPIIKSVSYTPANPSSAEPLIMTIKVQERNGVNATIDASSISTEGTFPKKAACTRVDPENFVCSVSVNSIISSYKTDAVKVMVEDFAGNKAAPQDKTVTIYLSDTEQTPNCFTVSEKESIPSQVDKAVASRVSMNLFAHAKLSSHCQDVDIISMQADCTAMQNLLADKPYIMNEDSSDPYIALKTLGTVGLSPDDTVKIDCELQLLERVGSTVFALPEKVNVDIDVPMYGNSLGELDSNIQPEITAVQDQIKILTEDIADEEELLEMFGMWCQIAQSMAQINSLAQTLKFVLWGVYQVIEKTPAAIIAVLLWKMTCNILSMTHWITEFIFWPSGIPPIYPPNPSIIGIMSKYGCMIRVNCAICDFSTYINLAVNVAAGYIGSSGSAEPSINFDTDYDPSGPSTTEKYLGWTSSDFLGSTTNAWLRGGMNTDVPGVTIGEAEDEGGSARDEGTWIFNPYKSKHYADACFCLPAQVYNLKKERQIRCMQLNCIQNQLLAGMSTNTCNQAYNERYCLYIESAQYLEHGYFDDFFSKLGDAIWKNLPYLVASFAWISMCYYESLVTIGEPWCSIGPTGGTYNVWCGLIGAVVAGLEIKGMLDSEFKTGYEEILGKVDTPDHCGG